MLSKFSQEGMALPLNFPFQQLLELIVIQEDLAYLALLQRAINVVKYLNPCSFPPWSTLHRVTFVRSKKPVLTVHCHYPHTY